VYFKKNAQNFIYNIMFYVAQCALHSYTTFVSAIRIYQ